MTELRKKVLDEIDSLYREDAVDTKLQNNLSILYNYIKDEKNLKDDQDIRIFLYANKDHAAIKPYSNIDDSNYTVINQIITGKEPKLIKEDINLKEIFGETYAEPGVLAGMKGKDLKKLTDENKVNLYDALKAAEDEAVKKDREDVFWGTNTLQQIFTPRIYESRMRGEAPDNVIGTNAKDFVLDMLENAAYTFLPTKIPKVAKGATNALSKVFRGSDKVAKGIEVVEGAKGIEVVEGAKGIKAAPGYVLGNAVNPVMMEGMDALAYGDDENTDRKDFSGTDAGIGTVVNVATPALIKGPLGGLANVLGGAKHGPLISKGISELGEGKSISKISREARCVGKPKNDLLRAEGGLKNQQNRINAATENVKGAEKLLAEARMSNNKLDIAKYEGGLNWLKGYRDKLENTTEQFVSALQKFNDKYKYVDYDDRLLDYVDELSMLDQLPKHKGKVVTDRYKQKSQLIDKVLENSKLNIFDKYNVNNELLDILKDVKFDRDRDLENYMLNYISNKFGDNAQDKASSIPGVADILKKFKEDELKEKRQKVRDSFSKMLLPDATTKESK